MCAGSTYCMSIEGQSGHKLCLASNSMPDTASGHQTCLGKHVGGAMFYMIIAVSANAVYALHDYACQFVRCQELQLNRQQIKASVNSP